MQPRLYNNTEKIPYIIKQRNVFKPKKNFSTFYFLLASMILNLLCCKNLCTLYFFHFILKCIYLFENCEKGKKKNIFSTQQKPFNF